MQQSKERQSRRRIVLRALMFPSLIEKRGPFAELRAGRCGR
jgi:hypothetical protein